MLVVCTTIVRGKEAACVRPHRRYRTGGNFLFLSAHFHAVKTIKLFIAWSHGPAPFIYFLMRFLADLHWTSEFPTVFSTNRFIGVISTAVSRCHKMHKQLVEYEKLIWLDVLTELEQFGASPYLCIGNPSWLDLFKSSFVNDVRKSKRRNVSYWSGNVSSIDN